MDLENFRTQFIFDNLQWPVLCEPRGLIKCIQFITAIFAFATTCFFGNEFTIEANCDVAGVVEKRSYTYPYSYPFRLTDLAVSVCGYPFMYKLPVDLTNEAEYFVATGILALLYCICTLVLYIAFDKMYCDNNLLPIADFVMHAFIATFWLTSSAVWAKGTGELKYQTDPDNFMPNVPGCTDVRALKCFTVSTGSYSTLNVSLIFGFMNFALWTSNLWFVYKETSWFRARGNPQGGLPATHTPPRPQTQLR